MNYKIILSIIILWFYWNDTLCQNPSHFVLGEQTLNNTAIYTINETVTGRLYVGTNQGLYEYRFGKMEVVPNAEEQIDTEIINLVSDSHGNVYCANLNGQIFRVENNKLKLAYTIPDKHMLPQIRMEIDPNDRLILDANQCFILEPNERGIIIRVSAIQTGQENPFRKTEKRPNGIIDIYRERNDTLIQIRRGEIKSVKLRKSIDGPRQNEQIIYLKRRRFNSAILNSLRFKKKPFDTNQEYWYYQVDNEEVWRIGLQNGLEKIKLIKGKPQVTNSFFSEHFISTIHIGSNGLLYLGTYGKGLFVIPNNDVLSYDITGLNNIQSIAVGNDSNIYLSDVVQGIAVWNSKKLNKVRLKDKIKIPDQLFNINGIKSPVIKNHPEFFYYNNIIGGVAKSFELIDPTTLLIAYSGGVAKIGDALVVSDSSWTANAEEEHNFQRLTNFKERSYDAVYDKEHKSLYIASISSLSVHSPNNETEELKINDKKIIANDLHFYDGKLWCATHENGIIVFKNNQIVKNWSVENGLASNYVSKMYLNKDKLYISHKAGFQVLNIKTENWEYIGKTEGIPINIIKDFSISQNHIWFAGDDRLISRPIEEEIKTLPPYHIKIDSVKLSGRHLSKEKNTSFSHNSNQLILYFRPSNFLYEDEIQLAFQLQGIDEELRYIPMQQAPSLTYSYLPPGEYSFTAKAIFRGAEGDPITFNFSIKPKFYRQWWFYILLIGGISLILWYRYYLLNRRAHEKIKYEKLQKEIIESDLKALRAQINPHFIFNSLSAIQNLILKQNTKSSYDYLATFSELIRSALQYSQSGMLSIRQEIDFLQSYLKLEKLRFGDDLHYHILIDKADFIQIPALILQPFIENALVHGLFHKKGYKKLTVKFVREEDYVLCIIIDNGIGRKKAKEIANRQRPNHISFALEATKNRFKILKAKHQMNLGFSIVDLYENKIPSGTKVIIKLPILL